MKVDILIAGDFCPKNRVTNLFEKKKYNAVLGGVKDYISKADYSIVNFECPVTTGVEKEIIKCGPNLQCSEKGMEAIKWVGFNCITLANNHFLDYGKEGVENTLLVCKKYGIDSVGGGLNLQEASNILYKEVKGIKFAIINCCEHEFSIATHSSPGSNPLNPIQQYYDIKVAKERSDYVIIIVHGGHEHQQHPSPRMKEVYRFFIDAGADVVVNHHQHCYSGYEVYQGKPIFYGLGNFCFDNENKRNNIWNEGYMVVLTFEKKEISYKIIPYKQCDLEPTIYICDISEFENNLKVLNSDIKNDLRLKEIYETFVLNSKENYLLAMEPYVGHWGGLRKRRIIPSLLTKAFFLRLYGYLLCESHLDRLLLILKKMIYNEKNH